MTALFTFTWDGLRRRDYNPNDWFGSSDASENHLYFNQAFVRTFPKILYTVPFTNWTNERIGITSRLTGTGETNWNEAQVRAAIIAGADAVGLVGENYKLNLSYKTYEQIQAGQNLNIVGNTNVAPIITQDGAKEATDNFWLYLGIGAAVTIILITRR